MTLVQSVKFESAARASAGDPDKRAGAPAAENDAPPLASGRFVDCHAVRLASVGASGVGATGGDGGAGVSAVADAIEQAWGIVRGPSADGGVVMCPMLLSPLHRLRLYFSCQTEDDHAVAPQIADGVQQLAKRLVAQQVAEDAARAIDKKKGDAAEEAEEAEPPAPSVDADVGGAWPYNAKAPTLLLVDSNCAARLERSPTKGAPPLLVCNPQTPVRDWFRVLNHTLCRKNADTRVLPLLTVEGSATSSPVYCAVRVPLAEDYHNKHQELRQWGVDHSKDPGLQWQVMCDYTKIAIKDMQQRDIPFEVTKLTMSHDRSLRGVLVQNYTDDDLKALRDRFGMRWLDES